MERARFRYSPEYHMWPGGTLRPPRVRLARHLLVDGGWIIPAFDGSERIADAPAEMHLRQLRDVDMSDPAELVGLFETVGPLVGSDQEPWAGASSPRAYPYTAQLLHERQAASVAKDLGIPLPIWKERAGIHVSEVALRVLRLRTMVDHLERALRDEPTAEVWQRAGMFEPWASGFGDPADVEVDAETFSWGLFAEMLNEGLAGVSPHVALKDVPEFPDVSNVVDANTAASVLIFNDLAVGRPYLTCADETCGRIFKRQLGRSSGAYNRTEGVAYCTPQHARNQSQRERRRRERAERARGRKN